MGYRSDVIVLIYPDAPTLLDERPLYDQLKVLLATTFKHVIDEHFEACMTWLDKDHVLKFSLQDVKWYPDYEDVKQFEAMLDAFQSEEIAGYCTEFIRVGEESDDVTECRSGGNNQYYLHVNRSIGCNV